MCAEDFSYYLEKFPGAFLWLGTGKEGTPALHNASFALDESILPLGIIMEAGACLGNFSQRIIPFERTFPSERYIMKSLLNKPFLSMTDYTPEEFAYYLDHRSRS